jgi:branched-chain amino acid aminotransferase
MAVSEVIWTWYDGTWHAGSVPVVRSADHTTWAGTLVFDGARQFEGKTPDLDRHCARINESARALAMHPKHSPERIYELACEGLGRFSPDAAVYVRPMYWSVERGDGFISQDPDTTDFCLVLEQIPMPAADASVTLTTTRFHRPTLDCATVNAKAACLYPNNARMIREAIAKGFNNALVTDVVGNVAETATSNVFMVKDDEVFTPIPNGTFLNGITRQRHIALLRAAGTRVHEVVLTLDDFRLADEVFLTGNLSKVTPVTAFDDRNYQAAPVTRRARENYWDWAASQTA